MGNLPAIITAVAGIIGIVINVFVNTWYRHDDVKKRRIEKDIEAYESYYLPLYGKILEFEHALNVLLETASEEVDLDKIVKYIAENNEPASLRNSLTNLNNATKKIRDFIEVNNFKYIKDYQLNYFYDKVIKFVLSLYEAKENKENNFDKTFKLEYIEKLLQRIEFIQTKISASCIIKRWYWCLWKKKN